jgi:tRNA threonylcarbamoyladenosine biosynthesis protein TsaE
MHKIFSYTYTLDTLDIIAKELTSILDSCSIMTFEGDLGAGKTTLIKKILYSMGVTDVITSPTYTYVNRYTNNHNMIYYHFDLYRLSDQRDFIDLGFDEYIYQDNSKALIEWPRIINDLIQTKKASVVLDYIDADSRKIECFLSNDMR